MNFFKWILLACLWCSLAIVFSIQAVFAKSARSSVEVNAAVSPHVATLDWTVAETLLALGVHPIGVGDIPRYQTWVQEPPLRDSVDLGLRLQPNLEQITQLPIELFINTSMYASVSEPLNAFAPVQLVDFYREGHTWQNIIQATRQIATLVGRSAQAEELIEQVEQQFVQQRPQFKAFSERPVAIVQFDDARHLRIYTQQSLLGEVLTRVGLHNAWSAQGNLWGTSSIDISQLAQLPENTQLIVVKPYPVNVPEDLKHNTLWQRLALAQDVVVLPPIWTFGGLVSAQRFAHMLLIGLQQGKGEL